MEKFTIDLDQVLNDFEYKELTDQYTTNKNVADTRTPQHQNVAKHSINNVFHSLNEYLNTNINVNHLAPVDNKFNEKEDTKNLDLLNLASVSAEEDSDSSVENTRVEYNCIEPPNCDLNKNVLIHNEIVEKDPDKHEKVVFCTERDTKIFVEPEINLKDQNSDMSKDLFHEAIEEKKLDITNETDVNHHEDTTSEINNPDKSLPIANELSISTENCIEQSHFQDDGTENDCIAEVINVDRVDVDPNLNEHNIHVIDDQLTEAPKNLEVSSQSQELLVNVIENSEEIIVVSNTKVAFDDEVNLDDNEINKLLAELEEDDELNSCEELQHHVMPNVTLNPISVIEEDGKNQPEENITTIEDNIDHNKKIAIESDICVPLDDKCEVTIIHEDYKLDNKDSVCDVTTTDIPAKIVEHRGDFKVEKVSEIDKIILEKETSQDSLSRPQNLPLKGEREDTKPKIDLIGEPGSTPYNNVYIDKEISQTHDSETESSTSSSPTFSDASNSGSTASTEEIQDENDKNLNPFDTNMVHHDEPEKVTAVLNNEHITMPVELPGPDLGPITESSLPSHSEENAEVTSVKTIMNSIGSEKNWLGKEAPLWIPDSEALSCLHCDMKFTVLKRRHHCRACGLVLCSKCCHLRFRLDYLEGEGRVCNKCHDILNRDTISSSSSDLSPDVGNSPAHRPNPNNPSEYCSTVSPLQQVSSGSQSSPPAVMVPVGVLKRKGSNKGKSNKSVMFCDGIRPGSDLTNLDNDFNYNNTKTKKLEKTSTSAGKINRNLPIIDSQTNTFIPQNENNLPPLANICKTEVIYTECVNNPTIVETLKKEQQTFAIHINLYVHLRVINMDCCINKMAWCFCTEGLINVGQDEIVILLEYLDEEAFVPKDIFLHISNVYNEAVKGTSVKELGISLHNSSNFLGCKNHAGFVYIRPTFQCLENIIKPKDPYLIGILIHRWETPWAKLFPLRLVLRLGAQYRYYPSPIISTRNRDSVFVEVGHTIINLLADFRNFSYTLPQIRGLTIHMEDKNTTVTIPANRYDQVVKSLNNSSDHILAFAGNFSLLADSHLVCIQDTQGNENCYSTHAINIQNKPRKITGASFIVFNGALKSSSGLTAKSNIVEDGLMIQVLPEHMQQIRDNLRAMKNHTIACGCVNAATDETVNIVWGENDVNFNVGVVSSIDNLSLSGVPSIRVHNAKNHVCLNGNRIIRWTEVFIIQNGEDNPKNQDPVDVSRVSESIAKATCDALVKYLDLLLANNSQKIGIRTSLQSDSVSYLAGSNGTKLPPIYMKSLDNELIPVLHRITSNLGENMIVLELIFRILSV